LTSFLVLRGDTPTSCNQNHKQLQ